MRRILVDAGPLVAALSGADPYHSICTGHFRSLRCPLVTCWPVLTEAAWLLRFDSGIVAKLLGVIAVAPFELAPLDRTDLPGIAAILTKYKNLSLQLADASLVHLANREGIDSIFTLDRRDFGVVRLAKGRKIRVLP